MAGSDKILEKIEYLPPFPATISKALHLFKDPAVSIEKLAETIKFDQAVTTNVLRLCNSTYFGLRRSITNLNEALVYIGLSQFRKILVLSGIRHYFEKQPGGDKSYDGKLWKHSLATSIIAENIGKLLEGDNEEIIFISALLHDVGKLVLSRFIAEENSKIHELVEKNEKLTFLEAEKLIFHIDHAELGATILERWGFPEEVTNVVKKHHAPPEDDVSTVENIVRLSDIVSSMMGYGSGLDEQVYGNLSELSHLYGIDHESIDKIMSQSFEEIKQIELDFGITGADI